MDTPTLRILETISSNIGDSLSIYQLTDRIKETYGSAYYANIYQKLQDLKSEGLLSLESVGRSSIIKLNFENYLLIDKLAEIEIEKKIDFLSERNNLFSFFVEMDKSLKDKCSIKSISSINPSKNIKLNKIELLFLLRETSDYLSETIDLYEDMLNLEKKHNLKINNLILDKHDFFDLITSDEINPVREALGEKIALFCPQAFWSEIKEIAEKNRIRTIKPETKPLNISDLDLLFNLNRFGYKEFGSYLAQGKKFCIEYIATKILLEEDARRMEALAVILTKNNFKSNLMAFLSQKYPIAPRLRGILKILQQLKAKPEIEKTIQILQTFNEEELPADKASIKQKLELYNVL
ncbi:MAG: hypothetical protein ABSF44_00110 [Candidatus Bathyarchaeia archaeon]|jgi:hypothetical protein